MNQLNTFQPRWASMPGDTIMDILKSKDISLSEFAKLMNSDLDKVKKLIYGKISIDEQIASKLHNTLGASVEFWINREKYYREDVNRLSSIENVKWLRELPTNDMIRLGWIGKVNDLAQECLRFFNVPNIWTWKKEYEITQLAAFRKSNTIQSKVPSVAAWIRQAEILSEKIQCNDWNVNAFKDSLLEMRSLIKNKNPKEFIPELRSICAKCGVALIIQRTPNGCAASGATKFITPTKALVLISFRYLTDDQFWFTFFHEAGHLILHNEKDIFIEEENNISKEEQEANTFSEEILIPKQFQSRLRTMTANQTEIKKLAKDADISLGIVVGQLQYLKRLNPKYLNGFKRKYELQDIIEVTH